MFLAEMGGTVAGGLEKGEVTCPAEVGVERSGRGSVEVAAFVATSKEAGSTCPASGGCNECIFKAHALRGEVVKVWSLDEGMARAPESVIALIVGEEEENIGLARAGSRKEEAQEEKAETRHGCGAWRKADSAKS